VKKTADIKEDSFMDREEQMILNLLAVIENEPDTTQKGLAGKLGVAVGVVNSYLKRVIYKGYVKTKSLQRRRLRYLLTPSGIKEKSRLTYEFLQYSYVYIRDVRRKSHDALAPLVKQGKNRIVFYGSGERAELAYITVRELGMELIGIVDQDCVGKRCIDQTIRDLEWLTGECDADVMLILNNSANESELHQIIEGAAKKKAMDVICL
jgi:DNA-binding MarR family transcriptional regulator